MPPTLFGDGGGPSGVDRSRAKRGERSILLDPPPRLAADSGFVSNFDEDSDNSETAGETQPSLDAGQWMINKYASWQGHQVLPRNFVSYNSPTYVAPLRESSYHPIVSAADLRAHYPDSRFPSGFWHPISPPYAHVTHHAVENISSRQTPEISRGSLKCCLTGAYRAPIHDAHGHAKECEKFNTMPEELSQRVYRFVSDYHSQRQTPLTAVPKNCKKSLVHTSRAAIDRAGAPHEQGLTQVVLTILNRRSAGLPLYGNVLAPKSDQAIEWTGKSSSSRRVNITIPRIIILQAPSIVPSSSTGIRYASPRSTFPNNTKSLRTAKAAHQLLSLAQNRSTNSANIEPGRCSASQQGAAQAIKHDGKSTFYTSETTAHLRKLLKTESISLRAMFFLRALTGSTFEVGDSHWQTERGTKLLMAVEKWAERIEIGVVVMGDEEVMSVVTY